MKTKLTLNVDDKIIARAKKISAKKNISLSSVVEEYLDKFSKNDEPKKDLNEEEPSLTKRIRKYIKRVKLPDNYDYKKVWHEHLDEKYGK